MKSSNTNRDDRFSRHIACCPGGKGLPPSKDIACCAGGSKNITFYPGGKGLPPSKPSKKTYGPINGGRQSFGVASFFSGICCRGFTLTEVMISTVLLVVAVSMSTAGLLFILGGERRNSVQNELDLDVRKSAERLTADLRLSAVDKMLFYPPGGTGSFAALSFPVALTNVSASLSYTTNGLIIWPRTVVYHVWTNTPNELRMTIINPRDNTLTAAQRQEQLNSIYINGNGSRTYESNNAHTYVIFQNLFDWSVTPKSGIYDGYNPTVIRDTPVNLGTAVLSNGMHRFTFTVKGKNPASTGYKIGIDTLTVSPSGYQREAENQLPVYAQSAGVAAFADYIWGGSWSGNYRLMFPATAIGNYFTLQMENDRWEETNFDPSDGGVTVQNTIVDWDDTLLDYVVRLSNGYDDCWSAQDQTGDTTGKTSTANTYSGAAIRILLRGKMMAEGGHIRVIGSRCYPYFTGPGFKIDAAYLAEAADSQHITMDTTGTPVQIKKLWTSTTSIDVDSDGPWGGPVDIPIVAAKSYLLTFLVSTTSGKGNPMTWTNLISAPMTNSWIIWGTNHPGVADITDSTWSDRTNVYPSPLAIGLERLWVTYPSNGVYTSPIFDTHLDTPAYSDMAWDTYNPNGGTISMKLRSGTSNDLSDALAWSNLPAMTPPYTNHIDNERYVQYQALFTSGGSGNYANWYTPELRQTRIRWAGQTRSVDIGGVFSQGPDHGIFDVMVDDQPLSRGISVNLTIYQDAITFAGKKRRLTSAVSAEVEPRNTNKGL